MGNSKQPPDKVKKSLQADVNGTLVKPIPTRASTLQENTTKRKRIDNSISSNYSSEGIDIAAVSYRNFTKSELKDYVGKLVKNTNQQNKKMNALHARIEEMSSLLVNLRSEMGKNKEKEPKNVPEDGAHSHVQTDDAYPSAVLTDCSDDDDMDTSINDELLNTTINTSFVSTQSNHCIESTDMNALIQRNRALRDAGSQVEERNSSGSSSGYSDNTGSGGTTSDVNKNKTQNIIGNKKANGKSDDNQIIISKPIEANKANNGDTKIKFNKKKSPEIVVYNIANKKETLTHLQSLLGHDRVLFRYINKDKTAILTENKEDRSKVLDFLSNNCCRYFTFTPSDEKPLNFLIKYVDESFSEEDVKSDILLINKEIVIRKLKVFGFSKR